MGWYEFNVSATDNGSPNKTGRAIVRVWVINTNNKSPVFEPPNQVAFIREKLKAGSLVHVVQAFDPDGPIMSPFKFSIESKFYEILSIYSDSIYTYQNPYIHGIKYITL